MLLSVAVRNWESDLENGQMKNSEKEEIKLFNTIQKMKGNEKGFTLIELLIVVAIIGILAAIAIPGYLGMQERGRKGGVIRVAEASAPELQAWMNSAKKAGTVQGGLTEVDSDGNGKIEAGVDATNDKLAKDTIITDWLLAHGAASASPAKSPWDSSKDLWVDGGVTKDLATCAGTAKAGQVALCYTPAADQTVQQMFIVAFDNAATPAVIFQKAVSAD